MPVSIVFLCFLFTTWFADGMIIYTAQCRSRCHSIYESAKDQTSLSQCLSPCDKDSSKLGNCRDYCKKAWGTNNAPCHYSCKFYTKLIISDYGKGSCSTKKPTHNYEYCDRKIRCDELKKCCSATNNCEDIVVHGEEVKVAVSDITSSSILARWTPSNITNAVYIIQLRELNSRSIHYTDDDWFPWEQIQQAVEITGVRLTGLVSGVRLQLRVAIANSTGLQSIGPPTPVIRTLFNASNPSSPDQIWVTRKSYNKDSVSVTLAWTPPVILDVPVHSYRVYWKQIPLITADRAVLTKKRTRVSGDSYNYTIQNLKPDTTYYIEIEAICLWKKKRLKSPKIGMNVSTGHIKDNGKGSIDVYFDKNKTKKHKEDNHPPRYYDESIENIDVLIERQKTTITPTSKVPKTRAYNSARRRQRNLWLTLILLIFCLFAFKTN